MQCKYSDPFITVPDVADKIVEENFTSRLSTLIKEDFQSELELQLHWDPLHRKPRENINQLRFTTTYGECRLPMKTPDLAVGVKDKLKKMPWENVYGKDQLCVYYCSCTSSIRVKFTG